MKSKYIATLVLSFVLVGLLSASAIGQEKMKYDDYLIELQKWQERENVAQQQIAVLEKEISELKARLSSLQGEIDDTNSAIWRAMETSESGFAAYLRDLESLRSQINGMLNLSPGELYNRNDEAAGAFAKYEEYNSSKSAKHPDSARLMSEIQRLLGRLESALENAGPRYDLYTVQKGDYLWRISGKSDIYGDPYQWLKIWSKNSELVKDPDVIYADWSLKIPRGIAKNEVAVARGDNLSLLAKKLYNDPFKWQSLYNANQAIVKDPNLIYPHMILIKP